LGSKARRTKRAWRAKSLSEEGKLKRGVGVSEEEDLEKEVKLMMLNFNWGGRRKAVCIRNLEH
jgi:hypothetical protein